MKKILKLTLFLLITLHFTQICFSEEIKSNQINLDDSLRLKNIAFTLLMPEVNNAVNTFYSQYLSELPTVAAFLDKGIIDIHGGEFIHERLLNSEYTIIVEVQPYIGPHLSVGKDRITLRVTNQGVVSVEKFMHMESYELPPNHQNIIIKPLP